MRYVYILLFSSLIVLSLTSGIKQPFFVKDNMDSTAYSKRALIPEKNPYKAITYNQAVKNSLDNINDSELLGFRCTDSFIRNNQGVYIFENKRINYKHTSRIKNNEFLEFMREKERKITKGKKILSGRICETEKGTILLFYSIGEYSVKTADSTSIRNIINNSTNNLAFLQIIPNNFWSPMDIFIIGKSLNHLRCDQPFQIGKQNELFILCDEEKLLQSTYTVNQINLKSKKNTILNRCINRFGDKLESICG